MKFCNAKLASATPYSQSKIPQIERFDKESADAFEDRAWRDKAHFDAKGHVFAPAMAFKQALDRSAAPHSATPRASALRTTPHRSAPRHITSQRNAD